MAGPNTLNYGDTVSYPTWLFGNTKLFVRNPDEHYPGKISVAVAGQSEDVLVYGGRTNHIERYWGGVEVNIYNIGGPTLVVWTE